MMKCFFCIIFLFICYPLLSQELQIHYDFRHSIDPELNSKNFLSLNFNYYKSNDKKKGAFFIQMQTDFTGENQNPGQVYLQITKYFRYWKPKFSLLVGYGGGFGVAPPAYGYYMANTYSIGISKSVGWKTFSLSIDGGYKYSAFSKVSHDVQLNVFFLKGFFNYKASTLGTISICSQNKDIGDGTTDDLDGKKLVLCAFPQFWAKIWQKWSIGTKVSCFYHVLSSDDSFQTYPTVGIKYSF